MIYKVLRYIEWGATTSVGESAAGGYNWLDPP